MKQELFPEIADSGLRIDKYLSTVNEQLSRSYIQKLLKSGLVLVDGKPVKASYQVEEGEVISLDIPEAVEPEIEPEDMDLDILYEDMDVILINKPKGMVVHPAAGHYSHTLVNGLMYHCKDQLSGINGVMRPGIVHRIDMDTTGVIIACKNDMAHNSIAAQLKEHSITRRYQAIVHGVLKDDTGTIDAPIGQIPDILYDETEDKDRFYYTVTRAVEDAYALEDTEITIKGNVCYLDFHEESAVFNIEDEDNSIKCIINYPKEEIEYNDMVYDFEYTKIIIETLQRGDHVNVKGRIEMENEDDAVFHVIEVEGDGFFIRCEA